MITRFVKHIWKRGINQSSATAALRHVFHVPDATQIHNQHETLRAFKTTYPSQPNLNCCLYLLSIS